MLLGVMEGPNNAANLDPCRQGLPHAVSIPSPIYECPTVTTEMKTTGHPGYGEVRCGGLVQQVHGPRALDHRLSLSHQAQLRKVGQRSPPSASEQ